MQNIRTNITKGKVKARHRDGTISVHDRYLLHYKDPATGKRRVVRFKTRKEAEAAQNNLIRNAEELSRRHSTPPTLREAVEYWLRSKEGVVAAHTFSSYQQLARQWIIGPAYDCTPAERRQIGMTGKAPKHIAKVPMLGANRPIDEIRTAEIRMWILKVIELSTPYVAKCARKALSSMFRLIEEDFDVRLARMPSRAGVVHRRRQRQLLTEEQVRMVIAEARRDRKWGVYYAFALFTGTRPNEQLGLLWEDVDLQTGIVRIHRSQQQDGSLKPFTKTDAGMREIPLNRLLLDMLREWRERCPRLHGELHRVFPAQQHETFVGRRPKETSDGGLSLNNYRNRVWYPMLKRLGLPQIPPYAARHMVISFLQAQGVEVGMVAKIAGHANPQVTLSYYTHAVRSHEGMMDELTAAYGLVEEGFTDSGSGVQI